MAARHQPRGTGLEVQYEDFVPKYEWEDQPEATILTIDLPGSCKKKKLKQKKMAETKKLQEEEIAKEKAKQKRLLRLLEKKNKMVDRIKARRLQEKEIAEAEKLEEEAKAKKEPRRKKRSFKRERHN
uniref:Uncharacterized protein n=1 Tax=Brassica oleracea TaxID=3712 RepID=A0A3P6EH16_BRAOL|nr:unnamed protein product [Brassica oleracea]